MARPTLRDSLESAKKKRNYAYEKLWVNHLFREATFSEPNICFDIRTYFYF